MTCPLGLGRSTRAGANWKDDGYESSNHLEYRTVDGDAVVARRLVNYRDSDVAFHDLLTAIANNSDGATVYHCSAGKDRTGWGTAILLTILGVPREVISADFMASNTYLGRDDAVDLSWLDAAYAQVDRLYGGMDTYVREGLGVDQDTIDSLRAKLLL